VQLHRYPHCTGKSYRVDRLYDAYVIELMGRATPQVVEDYRSNEPLGLNPNGWRTGENPIA
jgi:hypothetical protein